MEKSTKSMPMAWRISLVCSSMDKWLAGSCFLRLRDRSLHNEDMRPGIDDTHEDPRRGIGLSGLRVKICDKALPDEQSVR